MNWGKPITWAMQKVMVSKGNAALRRMDAHSLDALKSNEELLMRILADNRDTEYGQKTDSGTFIRSGSIRKRYRIPPTTITLPTSSGW